MKEQIPEKITFQGVIRSVQPRSNVWRYRLDNRTHSLTGYNLFLTGISNGVEGDFSVAISEKQQEKLKAHIGDEIKYEDSFLYKHHIQINYDISHS